MPTTISVPEDLADELYERKRRGESYADVIYRLIEQAESSETSAGDAGSDAGTVPDESPTPTPDATRAPETAPAELHSFDDVVEDVAEAALPGSGAKFDARREAFLAVINYLREHGTATPSEFQAEVYPDHPAWYESGQDPARSWWKNAMYPALAELAERTDEVASADQSGEWRWRGDA